MSKQKINYADMVRDVAGGENGETILTDEHFDALQGKGMKVTTIREQFRNKKAALLIQVLDQRFLTDNFTPQQIMIMVLGDRNPRVLEAVDLLKEYESKTGIDMRNLIDIYEGLKAGHAIADQRRPYGVRTYNKENPDLQFEVNMYTRNKKPAEPSVSFMIEEAPPATPLQSPGPSTTIVEKKATVEQKKAQPAPAPHPPVQKGPWWKFWG